MTKRTCSIEGCGKIHYGNGYCRNHCRKYRLYGNPNYVWPINTGDGWLRRGYKYHLIDGKEVCEHTLIAEKALGKKLPKGVVVHHVNEIKTDNRNSNLLICTITYHRLIHTRIEALKESGNANHRRCYLCRKYDDPNNLSFAKRGKVYHKHCASEYVRNFVKK